MTPKQLYALPPYKIEHDLHLIEYFVSNDVDIENIKVETIDGIEVRFLADVYIDGERDWRLFTVWFRNLPVMICQKAGRWRDHKEWFITDAAAYKAMTDELRKHVEPNDHNTYHDPDVEIDGLTEFWGDSLDRHYDVKFVAKYNVGDIVRVMVKKHPHNGFKLVPRRVRIDRIQKHNPKETYHGTQIDLRSASPEEIASGHYKPGDVVEEADKGYYGVFFSESEVLELLTPASEVSSEK